MISIKQYITELTFDQPLNLKTRSHHLRGAIGNLLRNNFLFHQHDSDGKPVYRYPLIQYKLLNEKGYIIGLAEGAESLAEKNF